MEGLVLISETFPAERIALVGPVPVPVVSISRVDGQWIEHEARRGELRFEIAIKPVERAAIQILDHAIRWGSGHSPTEAALAKQCLEQAKAFGFGPVIKKSGDIRRGNVSVAAAARDTGHGTEEREEPGNCAMEARAQ